MRSWSFYDCDWIVSIRCRFLFVGIDISSLLVNSIFNRLNCEAIIYIQNRGCVTIADTKNTGISTGYNTEIEINRRTLKLNLLVEWFQCSSIFEYINTHTHIQCECNSCFGLRFDLEWTSTFICQKFWKYISHLHVYTSKPNWLE